MEISKTQSGNKIRSWYFKRINKNHFRWFKTKNRENPDKLYWDETGK